jgi:hypothetical protein
MTAPAKKRAPDFVAAPNPTLASDLLDQLVAFEPLRQEVIDTKLGPSEAVIARVIEVCGDGSLVDHGECPVFWNYVRRQLLLGKEDARWVVGRLTKSGQAFRLESPTEEENVLFATVLAQVDES